MRTLQVKVCGMRDVANIAEVGALRPDYVGFIFVESSPRYVEPTLRQEEISLPTTVRRIGVFKDATISKVCAVAREFNLHGVQLHGDESIEYMSAVRRELPSLLIIKSVNVSTGDDIAQLSTANELPDLFLLDGKSPGSGTSFDWDLLAHYVAPVDFLLAGGVGASDLSRIVTLAERYPRLIGIDINSRVERAPGVKDIQKVKEVLTRLKV